MKKIRILVKPNAKTNSWGQDESGQMWMRIAAPPVEGKANDACIAFLSKILNLSKSSIELQKGDSSRLKTFLIPDETIIPAPTKVKES
ncbi:MAG TPA: DUF167 domain-containing protein, partial [Catalimonadaceae bacterium]|nr:DUF167 domain-containing protein [Catalimonadaceae bacterium]